MKIAIDISPIIYETGVSVYTEELVKKLLLVDKENQYLLFGGSLRRLGELKAKTRKFKGNFETRLFLYPPTLANLVWNVAHVLPVETLIGQVDVFHSSDWTQPPTQAFKVTTIHDLTPIKYPRLSHPTIVATHTKRFYWVKKEADAVIVPSQATKKDLLELDFREEKIHIIPEALPPSIKKASPEVVKAVKNRYRISGKYLLSIGVTPRKNIDRTISAFERVRAGEDLKLVVVGESKMNIEPARGVIFTGHVPFHELSALYTGAEALVYPSLYEGFGLPILEAFSCGTPVVTSNTSSMREVASGAAILVDPYRIESISEGIISALLQKNELSKLGRARVKEFTWEKTARKTLEVYKKALSEK
jgi:glycosyltransferase involved in cell wall biosynthesis